MEKKLYKVTITLSDNEDGAVEVNTNFEPAVGNETNTTYALHLTQKFLELAMADVEDEEDGTEEE